MQRIVACVLTYADVPAANVEAPSKVEARESREGVAPAKGRATEPPHCMQHQVLEVGHDTQRAASCPQVQRQQLAERPAQRAQGAPQRDSKQLGHQSRGGRGAAMQHAAGAVLVQLDVAHGAAAAAAAL